MHISGIDIKDLRSYRSASLEFAREINILIGENNAGKSTILDAICLLQSSRIGLDDRRLGMGYSEVVVHLASVALARFPVPVRKYLSSRPNSQIKVVFNLYEGSVSSIIQRGDDSQSPYHAFSSLQPDNYIVPYLSSRRPTNFQDTSGSQFALSVDGTLNNIQAKIDRCITSNRLRPLFQDACLSVLGFPISSFPVPNGKAAGIEVDEIDQGYIRISKMGSGVSHALGLIVELLTANENVFVIEEPEADLHPKALKKLLEIIIDAANRGSQIFVSTHSSVVLRSLGAFPGAKLFEVTRDERSGNPLSSIDEVKNDPDQRRRLLRDLGYELSDQEIFDAWIIFEESSAEQIVREFLIPWFTPSLVGRVQTVSAAGADNLEPRFEAFSTLFSYLHLESSYQHRAWVCADGDVKGREVIARLQDRFQSWPKDHFLIFEEPNFERYYPARFSKYVDEALAEKSREKKRKLKMELLSKVVSFLRADPEVGRKELKESASSIIKFLERTRDEIA